MINPAELHYDEFSCIEFDWIPLYKTDLCPAVCLPAVLSGVFGS